MSEHGRRATDTPTTERRRRRALELDRDDLQLVHWALTVAVPHLERPTAETIERYDEICLAVMLARHSIGDRAAALAEIDATRLAHPNVTE